MKHNELLSVVRALLEQPTAPFHEAAVRDAISAQLRECPHVKIEHDACGNMIARYRRGTRARPRWAFAAHMDHPGWVRGEMAAGVFSARWWSAFWPIRAGANSVTLPCGIYRPSN